MEDLIRDGVSLMALDVENQDKMVGIQTANTVTRYKTHICKVWKLKFSFYEKATKI